MNNEIFTEVILNDKVEMQTITSENLKRAAKHYDVAPDIMDGQDGRVLNNLFWKEYCKDEEILAQAKRFLGLLQNGINCGNFVFNTGYYVKPNNIVYILSEWLSAARIKRMNLDCSNPNTVLFINLVNFIGYATVNKTF